jgi:very-short-patch-repair endonuclease
LQALVEARTPGKTSGSGKENDLRRLLVSAGLPAPVTQHEIRDERGRFVARPDLAYPGAHLVIEYDGGHHADRRQWESDLPRQNRLINAGYRVLRYCRRDLKVRPDQVVEEVRRALDS